MYQKKSRVSFSQVGETGHMTPVAAINVMQDCSCEHSDSLGVTRTDLMERKRAWLLSFWQIVFDRLPEEGEEILVETRPWKFDRFFGHRNFCLRDETGEPLVRANSIWFYVNTEKMRPMVPEKEVIEIFGVDEPLDMEYAKGRKLKVPEKMEPRDPFPVLRSHLDTNHHVNNGQYVMMACEYFPENREIAELRAEYRTAAKYGDMIYPHVGMDDNGWMTVSLCREDGEIFVIVAARFREDPPEMNGETLC